MKSFHHIVAAIDFTAHCRTALKEAVHRASEDHANVVAVHVMDEHLVAELKSAMATDRVTVRKEWEQKLIKFVEETGIEHAKVNVEVRIGHPFTELAEACRVHQADLLVMGAKGSISAPDHLGVIAAKCIRKAPTDVLIVRQDAKGPFARVLTCVDFSENSAKAVQCGLHFAQQDQAAFDALYVYQSAIALSLDYGGMAPPVLGTATDAAALKNWESDLTTFLDPLLKHKGSVAVESHVVERVNIRAAILEHVKNTHADLVVLGTRGKSGLREMLIGTTAEKLVQALPCSILAVKPDNFIAAAD